MKNVLFLIIIGCIFYGIWRIGSPYPNPLNWDIWEHQTVINAIRSGSFAVLPSGLTDTFRFDGYTTAFHVILAGIQNTFNVQHILGFWWIAEGVFFVATTLASYAFVYALTKNKTTALLGGILSAGFFESAVAFTTLFLLPQTVAALLWVVGMIVVAGQTTRKRKLIAAGVATIIILPFHAIVGALAAVFLFIMALEPNIPWVFFLAGSYLIPAFIAIRFGLAGLNGGEAQYFNQSLIEKLALMRQWYGFLPIPFLALGVWKGNRTLNILLAISIGLLLSPFPYVLKFAVLTHYIMIALMAAGITKLRIPAIVTLSLTTVAVGIIFYANTSVWKQPVVLRGIASHISPDEQEAADFLKSRYAGRLLISDPATQHILEPISGVNTQGGAYMTRESRQKLLDILTGKTRLQAGTLLAVSARTMKWYRTGSTDQMNVSFNIWRPDSLSMYDELFIRSLRLTEVYENAGIVILKL